MTYLSISGVFHPPVDIRVQQQGFSVSLLVSFPGNHNVY